MKIFPKTLLARAFLLIVALILLSLASSLAIFRHLQEEPRAQQTAQLAVSVVNLTRAAVLSAAPEWRGALLDELADAEGLRVQPAESDEVLKPLPERPAALRLMAEKIRSHLGDNTRLASERNGVEALWVSFFIGNEEFWVSVPRERIERPASQQLLVWGGVVALLALLGGYFIARQVARPLKRLAGAARLVGEGKTPPPLPELGAQEVVAVAQAFNRMTEDLAAHERERAIVLAGISHDLRTPLARVRLAAEMTQDAALRDGMAADVEQMDAVIRQFLDYARLDENETVTLTDVAELVRDVAQQFAPQVGGIELDLAALPPVPVRPLLLKRALANLLDNAVKYGGGKIAVRLRQEGGRVVLSVLDCGPGIPEAQREAVKRPFVRVETARSDAGGSGLGLAIVARAARLHGGELRLEAREGGGLAASLAWPMAGDSH